MCAHHGGGDKRQRKQFVEIARLQCCQNMKPKPHPGKDAQQDTGLYFIFIRRLEIKQAENDGEQQCDAPRNVMSKGKRTVVNRLKLYQTCQIGIDAGRIVGPYKIAGQNAGTETACIERAQADGVYI